MKDDSPASTIKAVRPPAAPCAAAGAEAQVLIEEARAHARRRRRRLALAVAGTLAVTAGVFAAVRGFSGSGPAARGDATRPPTAVPAPAAPPRFFADTQGSGEGNGPLQIRESATGKLVWQDERGNSSDNVTGLAATGRGSFVVALNPGSSCTTRLYRVRLSSRGLPGALSPLGPALPGRLWSLTAGDGGRVIGYAISGCSKGDPGYLGVLHVASGRTRQWGDVDLGGSSGNLALEGPLSMSANGRLLAFVADSIARPPFGRITAQSVRVLPVNAPPGAAATRSHVVYRQTALSAGAGRRLAAARLSPRGTSLYLCLQSATRTQTAAKIVRYDTTTGKPQGVITNLTAEDAWPQTGCSSMTLDTSGRFLLVPYSLHHLTPPSTDMVLQVATISIATKTMSAVAVRMPGSGGMSQEGGMSIVAW